MDQLWYAGGPSEEGQALSFNPSSQPPASEVGRAVNARRGELGNDLQRRDGNFYGRETSSATRLTRSKVGENGNAAAAADEEEEVEDWIIPPSASSSSSSVVARRRRQSELDRPRFRQDDPIATRICELFDELQPLELEDDPLKAEKTEAVVTLRRKQQQQQSRQQSQEQRKSFFERRRQTVSGYFNDWSKWLKSGAASNASNNNGFYHDEDAYVYDEGVGDYGPG